MRKDFTSLYDDYTGLALWDVFIDGEMQEFSGLLLTPGSLLAATEEGSLYRIDFEEIEP